MRFNGTQCGSVKETTMIRVLRSTKVSSGAERQQPVFSDISNSQCQGREKKNEHSVKAGKCARKNSLAVKEAENGNYVKPDGLSKPRRCNVVCPPPSCTTIGRKRVVGVDGDCGPIRQTPECLTPSHSTRSPEVYLSGPEFETSPRKRLASPSPPSTPAADKSFGECLITHEGGENGDESPFGQLPFDLLVRIVCCLQHDELKPVLQVCGRLRNAVSIARQFHFNFTTPGRSKREKLGPLNFRHVENSQIGLDVAFDNTTCPRTPNAPRHVLSSPQRRISDVDLQPFAAPLFQESSVVFPYSGNFFRKSRPICRNLPSHRVLFYEDELCQAVAQNTI